MNDLNIVSGAWMFGGTAIYMIGDYLPLFYYLGLVVCFLSLVGFLIPDKLYNKLKEDNQK